jgi:hypothetical protein
MSKAGKPPMKQFKNSVLTSVMYAMFLQVMITMLMAILGQLFWGSASVHVGQTFLAVGRQ